MRAVQIVNEWGVDALQIRDVDPPKLGHGEARIRVRAASLNFRDLRVAQGLYNPKVPKPLTICSDCAGEVIEVGAGVSRVKVGDRVSVNFVPGWIAGTPTEEMARGALGAMAQGVLAEEIVQPESALVACPPHLSFEEAATLPCAAVTAWHGLVVRCGMKAGDAVLTLGTGGVSLFALQFARMHGARVIATSSSDEKLARLREMGASETINYTTTPDWEEAVRKLSNGGVDHVIDIGGTATLNKCIRALRRCGNLVSVGVVSGGAEAELRPAFMKGLTIHGLFVGSREMFEEMNRAIAVNQMRPVVDRVFAFEETKNALRHMEAGAHFGKIAIRI
jgi:NADPH:quinone reductase-like Zn-dependent oxidoreductase